MKKLFLIQTFTILWGLANFASHSTPIHDLNLSLIQFSVCDSIDLSLNVSPSSPEISCDFPCVTLSASGGSSNGDYIIEWEDALEQNTLTVCQAGVYLVIITDLNSGCTNTQSVTVSDYELPIIDAGPDMEISCVNSCTALQAILPNIQDDFSIEWTGPDNFISNELIPYVCVPGTYLFSVHESGGGCTITDSMKVEEVYEALYNSLQLDICPGDCYTFGGETYCEAGNYMNTFESAQQCDSIVILQLNQIPIVAEIDLAGIITCAQPQLLLNTFNSTYYSDATYEWSTADGNIISGKDTIASLIDLPGTYFFSIKWNGCTAIDSIVVTANQIDPDANAGEDVELDCIDLQTTLSGALSSDTIGKSYSWIGPDNFYATEYQVQVDKAGIYELTVQDNTNGCLQSDDVIVEAFIPFEPELSVEPSCFNDTSGSIEINNDSLAPFYEFSVRNNLFQDVPKFESLGSGDYQLVWKDDHGCGDTLDVNVPELSAIDFRMEDSYSICGDNYITLNAAVNINETPGPVTYLWNDGASVPAMRTNRIGNFWVEITSACEVYRHEFEVSNELSTIDNNIYVPNAFSPNSDYTNDRFRAYVNHEIIAYQLQVYDRRGGLMFSTENPVEGWDGTIKGVQSAVGVYSWWLRITIATCGGGRSEGYLSGDVSLFR